MSLSVTKLLPLGPRMMLRQVKRAITGKGGDIRTTARSAWYSLSQDRDWADYYWNDLDAPQRKAMLTALDRIGPFKTLLELGSNAGPNLRLIHERHPAAELTGVEMIPEVAGRGRAYFQQAGIGNVTLKTGTFDQAHGKFDVVLSMWALTCSPPEEIGTALDLIDAQTILLIEPSCEGKSQLHLDIPSWKHDYPRLLRERGYSVETYPVDLDQVDKIIIARRAR